MNGLPLTARVTPSLPLRVVLNAASATLLLACGSSLAWSSEASLAALSATWEKPRELTAFRVLLARSPFSLPTAEENSPLAERYALTGVITISGEEQVFVFDRTDQSRELLTAKPNAKNMSLVSLIREGNTPLKASIRVGSEMGTIGFLEAAQAKVAPPAPGTQAGTNPAAAGVRLPPLPAAPQQPSSNPPNRRIIRRPVITAPQNQPATP